MISTTVWETYRQQLSNFVRKRIDNPMDAEDVLQETLYKAFRNHHQLSHTDKLEGWLYQIARHTIIDYYRNRPQWFVPLEDEIAPFINPLNEETDEHQALLDCVVCLVDALPEKYRTVLVASDLQEMPQYLLSQQLGLSYSGTKSRVQRGREKLRQLLEVHCAPEINQYQQIVCCAPQQSSCNCVI